MDPCPRPTPQNAPSPPPPGPTGQEWAATRLVRRTQGRFAEGWDAVSPAARHRWFGLVAAGFVLMCGLVASLTWAARSLDQAGLLSWERSALRWIEASWPFSFSVAVWIEIPGNSLVLWPLMGFAAGWAAWTCRPLRALSIAAGFVLLKVTILLGWMLWERPRPTVILDGLMAPGFNAFPSGHSASALFAYGLLASFWMRASNSRSERCFAVLGVLFIAIMISVGRLRVGAHWPTDMLAGVIIGAAWLAVVVVALRLAETRT